MTTEINQISTKPIEAATGTQSKSFIQNRETSNSSFSDRDPIARSTSPEGRRTMIFVIGAVVCLAITAAINWSNRPAAISEFGKIGQAFYPEFIDPTLATSLEVYMFDAEKVRPLDFRVHRMENGRWVIPSHHNYPADAERSPDRRLARHRLVRVCRTSEHHV